jgi:hypothetical protein
MCVLLRTAISPLTGERTSSTQTTLFVPLPHKFHCPVWCIVNTYEFPSPQYHIILVTLRTVKVWLRWVTRCSYEV